MTAPTPPQERPSASGGGGLTGKVGPLPAWAWIGLAAVGGLVVLLYLRSRQNAAAAASTTDTTGTVAPSTADVANLQDQLATVNSQIRDLQGGPSQSMAPTGADSQAYLFNLGPSDPNKGAYAGIPGKGWYWIPDTNSLAQYTYSLKPVDLGTISQTDAASKFGPLRPWPSLGKVVP